MNKYKVAIIGAGSIGGDKPDELDSPTTENVFTHAHAVYAHSQTELIAVIDSDAPRVRKVSEKWNTAGFREVVEFYKASNTLPDIVIVSTPTETHVEVIREVLPQCLEKPKLFIVEKPFGSNSKNVLKIIKEVERHAISILVNYTRRFDPAVQRVKRIIDDNELGQVQNCRVIYNRGLRRDGCHAIDLLNYFFGNMISGEAVPIPPIVDFSLDDPTQSIWLSYENCPCVFMSPADGRKFNVFEIDILFDKGRIIFENSGLNYRINLLEDSPYGHYKSLSYNGEARKTGMDKALWFMIDNAVKHLDNNEPLLCTGEDALKVHKVIEFLRK